MLVPGQPGSQCCVPGLFLLRADFPRCGSQARAAAVAVLSPVLRTPASGSVVSVDVTSKGCSVLLCGCTSLSMETRKQIEDQARPLAAWAGGGSLSGRGHPCHLGALCTWPGPSVWGTVRQGGALRGRADLWLRSLWVRGGWDAGAQAWRGRRPGGRASCPRQDEI